MANFELKNCILGSGQFVACIEYEDKEKKYYNGVCVLSTGVDGSRFIICELHRGLTQKESKEEGEELLSLACTFAKAEIKAIEENLYQQLLELEKLHHIVFMAELDAFGQKVNLLQKEISNGH